ncbi:GDSL-type esterase/lipase family protein [Streptosporangium sp. NBC_01639]|uniref:SGNH/GDSL hydrolase family protein n=1 Tax=Streptosporangium sp. NBC_01639 TaxID=2975948 RepID=UPI0038683684|nr:GDSL-type esterase/lipase family protein [Streptosporangium sp. NBC_01639]
MNVPRRTLTLIAAAILTSVPATAVADTSSAAIGAMASMGDSITRGFNACGFYLDCPSRSWSTGSNSAVDSHYRRLRADNPSVVAHNDARSGAKVADLAGQAQQAVSQGAGYVTILIGANDACTSSESGMTSVADFEARFRTAMQTLATGLPTAEIFVSSIPDIKRLWEVGKDSSSARAAWATLGICKSMLANPRSTAQADVDRRERVRTRVTEFNAVLAAVCAEQITCRYDGGAVFGYPFALSQISTWDYFHPNASGQQVLAEVTYNAVFAV